MQSKSTEFSFSNDHYGRDRRLLGCAYVGTIVLTSAAILCSGSIPWILSGVEPVTDWFGNMFVFITLFEVITVPFDLAGFSIERHYGRTTQGLRSYVRDLIRATISHALLFLVISLLVTVSVRAAGMLGLFLLTLFLSLVVVWKQTWLAHLYSDITFRPAPQEMSAALRQRWTRDTPILLAGSQESGFTGGVVGLPGAEKIVIPASWLSDLSDVEVAAEITRRKAIIDSDGRTRGVVLSVVFTTLGVLLSAEITTAVFSRSLDSSAGLITMSLCFTLWSFVGLLTLPYSARLGVYEADRLALGQGVSRELLSQTMSKINKNLEDESSRSLVVETIFHPVPTVINRLAKLKTQSDHMGAWHSARYAVVISIVGLGLLGRAVHCNAGKPVLWALPPAD